MDMAAVDLPFPSIPYFYLAVAGGRAIADDEMVGKPILHSAKMPVVIIEGRRIPLTSPAVMDHDVLPASARNRRAIDLCPHGCREIAIGRAAPASPPTAAKNARPESPWFFVAVLFNRQLFRLRHWRGQRRLCAQRGRRWRARIRRRNRAWRGCGLFYFRRFRGPGRTLLFFDARRFLRRRLLFLLPCRRCFLGRRFFRLRLCRGLGGLTWAGGSFPVL